MKKRLVFLAVFGVVCLEANNTAINIINNTDLPLDVGFEMPSYSLSETKITSIRSQQELQDLLYKAILTNSTQEIMQAVRMGADVNLFKDGKAPLMWAKILKKFNSVEVLKKCGAVIPCPKNMLYRAILNDSADEVVQAINAGANPNDEGIVSGEHVYPLGLAVYFARSNAVQALLSCGASIISMGTFRGTVLFKSEFHLPLAYALSIKDLKTALILLRQDKQLKANKIFADKDVLEYVLQMDPSGIKNLVFEFVQELIKHGYDINSNGGKSAWISAISSEFYCVEMLELLMKNGANPNQFIHGSGGSSFTPLHAAVQVNNISAVRFLLNAGADVNKKADPTGARGAYPVTALSFAETLSHFENAEIIKCLMFAGKQ